MAWDECYDFVALAAWPKINHSPIGENSPILVTLLEFVK
jgi:hypothetical protein